MNSFFINITKGLKLKEDNEINANILEDMLLGRYAGCFQFSS